MTTSSGNQQLPSSPATGRGVWSRLGWMMLGPLGLFVTVLSISKQPQWDLSIRDLIFVALLAGTVWIRYVDVVRYEGTTANGAPATRADVSVFGVGLAVLSVGLWTLAHLVDL